MASVAVRADLFDHMTCISGTMDQVRIDFVTDLRDALPVTFPTFDDAARYVNSLGPKDKAELLCEMARFYKVSKQKVTIPVLQLTMIITIVERLQTEDGASFLSPWDFLSQAASFAGVTFPINNANDLVRVLGTLKQNYVA